MTTVISVRGKKPAELLADPDFCYVGRAMPRQGWKGSIWGNPFKPGMDPIQALQVFESIDWEDFRQSSALVVDGIFSVADAVEWYEQYVKARRSLWERLPDLRSRVLGCWCCDWDGTGEPSKPCHAVVLARLADAQPA
jgi:hypothetical protein